MYNLRPNITISDESKIMNFNEIPFGNKVTIECYHGVDYSEIESNFEEYKLICIDDYFIDKVEFEKMTCKYITNDRVFGKMNNISIRDMFEKDSILFLQSQFDEFENIVIYGVGASLIKNADTKIYIDIPRWEIQKKYRRGLCNLNRENKQNENITKFKIGYFLDWRICDNIKRENVFDYYVEGISEYKVLKYGDYINGLRTIASTPFRMVPYFDPGIWGGDWMKQKFSLPENGSNYAWSFDGVVEENSIILKYGKSEIEIPAINIIFSFPNELLGENILAKYGEEWPIRFDYLDTYNGDNLSLQVHPKKEYIKEKYGMKYTQDESYYFMECGNDSKVYLGVKENIDIDDFTQSIRNSEENGLFDVEKFVNVIEVKQHDHVSIPAGTIHCSGKNSVVLEISATPYIFTYKMYDWGRVGSDGIPRPLHIEDGLKNIDYSFSTSFVKENFITSIDEKLEVQKTGLNDLEPIEVHRYKIDDVFEYQCQGKAIMGNLVSGNKVLIKTPGKVDLQVNYGETFIIPACVCNVVIEVIEGENTMILMANIKE